MATAFISPIPGSTAGAAPPTARNKLARSLQSVTTSDRAVVVTAYLADNSFLNRLPVKAERLLRTSTGARAARLAAQRDPSSRSDSESVAASIADNARNAALPMIRLAARRDVAQNKDAQTTIRALGGRILSASPIPNQVTIRIRARALPLLARDRRVAAITPAHLPTEMAAPIDGSSTWWTNGYFGQGSSLDGNGSPDAVVFDQGIRTTHVAFKTRLPGDCGTCDGSGPSRIISPVIRTDFAGSKHANTIAAEFANTSLSSSSGGMAYKMDKLYDNYESVNPYLWDLGITTVGDPGLGGNSDLPEVINYSAGIYEDTADLDPAWNYYDALESRFGILQSISAGNCGIADPFYTNCGDGPHRVSAPGTNYNVITVGGLDSTTIYPDTSGYIPWANTSPGPTWGGRKKPDVIAPIFGTASTPSAIDDTSFTSAGVGTSFAAPVAGAGAILLASAGIYSPTAQKAIMVNSATPVQGQTYWSPRTGWGALNMSNAFFQRGNYVNSSVTASGANGARFFKLTGVSSGDRSTLVWNRRTNIDTLGSPTNGQILNPGYYNLTNLDLSQFNPSTLATTSTGGSDAADTVDRDTTASVSNPLPGNGSDTGDNVEQVHSTSTGTQILKVKAMSAIDGASSEPFSIASADPITAIQTPQPTVSLSASPSPVGLGQDVTVTATVTNPSADLALDSPSIQLSVPAGASITNGANPQMPVGSLGPSGTTTASWTIQGTSGGSKSLSATASGTAYGESFAGTGSTTTEIDGTPPDVTTDSLGIFADTASPNFSWSAIDSQTSIASYDVQMAINNDPWSDLLIGTTSTSVSIPASDGQMVNVRVRATDTAGNTSPWRSTSTAVDISPPTISFAPPSAPSRGQTQVAVTYGNEGAPITSALYSFGRKAATPTTPLVAGNNPSITNLGTAPFDATLTVTVTDWLGRSVTKSQIYSVPPKFSAAALTISRPTIRSTGTTIAGKISSSARGTLTLTVRRTGHAGTRRVRKQVAISGGRYRLKVKLKAGKYKATVSWPGDDRVMKDTASRSFLVRKN